MKDFLRRVLALLVAESLLFAPGLWGDGHPGEDSTRRVNVNQVDSQDDSVEPAGEPEDSSELLVSALVDKEGGVLEGGEVRLHVPPGAVSQPMEISIYRLGSTYEVLEGRQNVTGGAHAYRFLPAGAEFALPLEIFLPYDELLDESEAALEALYTYFYNEDAHPLGAS